MDIPSNHPLGRTVPDIQPLPDAGMAPPPAAKASRPVAAPNLTITRANATSGVDAIPEDALTRDDALGLLVSSAFTLPAPPPPAFPDSQP